MKKRLFIAIAFPSDIKKQIGRVIKELKKNYPQIRWEKEENLHLTLKFLGWVEEELKMKKTRLEIATPVRRDEKLKMTPKNLLRKLTGQANQNLKLNQIIQGVEKARTGIKPFWFQLTTIGYFLKDSLIVWLGAESQEGLLKLGENLEREMAKIGFPQEKRAFMPHITLGRLRHAHPVAQWRRVAQELEHFPAPQFEKFKVGQIVLMESQLIPSGAIYNPLRTWNLLFS